MAALEPRLLAGWPYVYPAADSARPVPAEPERAD
eukprot:SAG11_NODE_26270_length_347_cov_1.052419_1_plen_33_part_10